ncbi:erythronate-4-phosphate dehydrogenase [Acinetobacter calcoaceticus]|uniref:Erythronate-4-phosphate dehydrogenase n=1 Tax=Acinetobacter calcoaceticus TaxID=471 RepID=A0A4R1XYR4_ACICA|nr:erythronate-4-phosphate dehydrogenase [Acinetobacter calcoaceticus]
MNIVADENLALTEYFFAEFGKIHHVAGRHLTQPDVQDAEVLLVRSVTQVNHALIENTELKFVGSATIGTDHLDQAALAAQDIVWSNAAGCNAQAVAEYVISAILHLQPQVLHQGAEFCLGIVGLGNVGSRLAAMATLMGWSVIGYDPLVQHHHIEQADLATVLSRADALSLHVPLTQTGPYPTHHLLNATTLAQLKDRALLINSARGPVIEEQALIADIQGTGRAVVLDVFEHEPVISATLLNLLQLATPHIAGYSLEGKARGTQMIYNAFCDAFALPADKDFRSQLPEAEPLLNSADLKAGLGLHLKQIYDIASDDAALRACLKNGVVEQAAFDHLRKHYPLRREWAAHGGPQA